MFNSFNFKTRLYLLILSTWPLAICSQSLMNLTFNESMEDFANPERGFFHARELPEPQNFDVRGENITLIYGRISADEFRDKPFSKEYVQAIQNGFDQARKYGIKVNPRVAYNHGPHPGNKAKYGDDAPLHIVLTHIAQLKPLWHKNKDVINVLDAGFIGGWGEWHNSAHGLDSLHNRRKVLFAILDALPKDRMVVQRAPHYKRAIFTGSEINADSVLTRDRAFDGSNLSRVGHLNDCFLSSENDVGTYAYQDQGWSVARELEYIGRESQFVPFGGETCGLDLRGECFNSVPEMAKLHINYLNIDYNKKVLNLWKEQGCYDEISRRIGYRFVLKSAQIPEKVMTGQSLNITFTIKNVGFAELFNPRKVEVVLIHNETKKENVFVLDEEPRFWSAGQTSRIDALIKLTATIKSGVYSIGLRLPDLSPSIHDDPRYAVRFANENTWVEETGINMLYTDLIVSSASKESIHE